MASHAECERCFEAYVVISTCIFRCSGNATASMLLLESFAGKKRFCRRVSANTARFLRLASLQTLRIFDPEGIANFCIALAKHCNLVFCSFVPQID